jgi:hypothetical protein
MVPAVIIVYGSVGQKSIEKAVSPVTYTDSMKAGGVLVEMLSGLCKMSPSATGPKSSGSWLGMRTTWAFSMARQNQKVSTVKMTFMHLFMFTSFKAHELTFILFFLWT